MSPRDGAYFEFPVQMKKIAGESVTVIAETP